MAGARRSAPLHSADCLTPTGVVCVPVCLGGSWHSDALMQSPAVFRLSPLGSLFLKGVGRDP